MLENWKGPEPMGCKLYNERAKFSGEICSQICWGISFSVQFSKKEVYGVFKLSRNDVSESFWAATSIQLARRELLYSEFWMVLMVKTTSSAVRGLPSSQVRPLFKVKS